MREFELNDEIEISNYSNFYDSVIGLHKFTNVDKKKYFADVKGYLIGCTYARKIEPRVMIHVNSNVGETLYHGEYEIPISLMDKIKAGEFK